MILDQTSKDSLQDGINNLIATEFPWCKEQIIRSRESIPIEDADLWMRYRNAMDRLLSIQRGVNFGEFPSLNLAIEDTDSEDTDPEDMGGIGITDPSNPHDILQYSTYLFRNCGVEAWVQATETLIGLLEIRINSFSYHGDKANANLYLKQALKQQAEARLVRSSSHTSSVEQYKKASKTAESGLDLLEKVNPYTRGSFWIAIGILLVALIALLHNLSII